MDVGNSRAADYRELTDEAKPTILLLPAGGAPNTGAPDPDGSAHLA